MSRTQQQLLKRLAAGAFVALGISSQAALADDSSMNPFTGESYAYFHDGHNLGESNQASRHRGTLSSQQGTQPRSERPSFLSRLTHRRAGIANRNTGGNVGPGATFNDQTGG